MKNMISHRYKDCSDPKFKLTWINLIPLDPQLMNWKTFSNKKIVQQIVCQISSWNILVPIYSTHKKILLMLLTQTVNIYPKFHDIYDKKFKINARLQRNMLDIGKKFSQLTIRR